MHYTNKTLLSALAFSAGAIVLTFSLSTGAARVSAFSVRSGELHVTKECSQDTGLAGGFCTITSSNLPEIKVGSKVFYDQASGIPPGFIDSNVVLSQGTGNWAVGRCTLDSTFSGLCTYSDGVGPLTRFKARVVVTYTGGSNFRWDGPYSFGTPDED